jgi:hypothetical protein
VAELEQENARLRDGMAAAGRAAVMSEHAFQAEVDALRGQLSASEQRATAMRAELHMSRHVPSLRPLDALVKNEPFDPSFPSSKSQSAEQAAATKLGLMVHQHILCLIACVLTRFRSRC